jgi:hypothetical protein
MAVTIWRTNKIPTAVATLLADIECLLRDVRAVVVVMVVMACPS